jgi:ABC-type transport system involved in multi-copper enzyme maturation permease subunit
MLGPIFNAEMLRGGRRGRAHVLRWLYGGWLCAQLIFVYNLTHPVRPYYDPRHIATSSSKQDGDFGRRYRDLVLSQQFLVIMLVTPAFVAGAITDEKSRGTLAGLLTSYITPADIVIGKLAARCTQVAILALTPLPLLALVGQNAGIAPEFLLCLVAVTVMVLAGLGGVSMLASVWTRQTRNAVLATYVALLVAAGLLDGAVASGRLPSEWKEYFDPLAPLWPALDRTDTAEAFRRVGHFALAWGGLGLLTATVAAWRLRPAYLGQLGTRPRRPFIGRIVERPRPRRDVIAWKECYVGRRIPTWLGAPVVCATAAAAMGYLLDDWNRGRWNRAVPFALTGVGGYIILLLTLLVGIRSSGSITGERERQTWDGLMTTPLTGGEVVRGKLRGIMRSAWPYVIAAWLGAAVVGGLAAGSDPLTPLLVMIVGLGLAGLVFALAPRAGGWLPFAFLLWVAGTAGWETALLVGICVGVTWLAMYFLGAVGMYCTAKFGSSWRSLLATIAFGYAGGSVIGCVGLPLGCVGTIVVSVLAEVFESVVSDITGGPRSSLGRGHWISVLWTPVMALGSAFLLWIVARLYLTSAEKVISRRDRFMVPDWAQVAPPRFQRRASRRISS